MLSLPTFGLFQNITEFNSQLRGERAEAKLITQSNKFKEAKDDLSDEIGTLKESLNKYHEENKNKSKNLSEVFSIIKQKEKKNYNLWQNL